MDPKQLIEQYINEKQVMQLATVRGGKPWICTVHYIEDDQQNLYWLSLPTRRHSQDIAKNSKVAVAIAVKTDHPVIGIQLEGQAQLVEDHEVIKTMMRKYVDKFHIGGQFYDNVVAGINKHIMYKFTPENFVLFDEVNFKEDSRKEWPAS